MARKARRKVESRKEKKVVKKAVRKDIRKDIIGRPPMRTLPRGPRAGRKRDAVDAVRERSQYNARRAALATLDPRAVFDSGPLPGVPDGRPRSTVRWTSSQVSSAAAVVDTTRTSSYYLLLRASPSLVNHSRVGLTYNNGIPQTFTSSNDPTYTAAAAQLDYVRCVAMSLDVRCISAVLDLEGSFNIIQGDASYETGGIDQVFGQQRMVSMTNSSPGAISRMPWLPTNDREFWPVAANPSTATEISEGSFVYFTFVGGTAMNFEWTITSIWEGVPSVAGLAVPTLVEADPATYCDAITAALDRTPLYSPQRLIYDQDHGPESLERDIATIMGQAADLLGDVKSAYSGITAAASWLSDGLFGRSRDPTDEEAMRVIAAYLCLLHQRKFLTPFMNLMVELKTEAEVETFVDSALGPGSWRPNGPRLAAPPRRNAEASSASAFRRPSPGRPPSSARSTSSYVELSRLREQH